MKKAVLQIEQSQRQSDGRHIDHLVVHYTMVKQPGANLFYFIFLHFAGTLYKTISPLVLVGCEMIITNSALHTLLAIYHLISNMCSWNNCQSAYLLIFMKCTMVKFRL